MINLLIPEQDLQRQINAQEHEHRAEINKLKKEKEQKFQISGALIEEKKGFEVCPHAFSCISCLLIVTRDK